MTAAHAPDGIPRPEEFEPILETSPDDLEARESAMSWYALFAPDAAKAKHHTREMLRWHPDSHSIYANNITLFDREPAFRGEVESALEAMRATGRREHGLLATLASVVAHRAIAPRFESDVHRHFWLQYFGLPDDYPIESHASEARARKAVGYLREAIAAAHDPEDSFSVGLCAKQLLDLLIGLNQPEKAADAAAEILRASERAPMPELQLTYGSLLSDLGRWNEARTAFEAAIEEDQGQFQSCGHLPARARLGLGTVALVHDDDLARAIEHLLAASAVAPCIHTRRQGVGVGLAQRLVDRGERDAVRRYCETVLRDVCPSDRSTQLLLASLGDAPSP